MYIARSRLSRFINMGTASSAQLEYDQLPAAESDDNDEWLNNPDDERHLLDKDRDGRSDRILHAYKYFKTCSVITVWICLGMVHAVASPTLPDLRDRLNTNMEDLSLALGFRSFGALGGSVICGMLADRYREKGDLVMGIAVIFAGFPEIVKPLTDSLIVVGAMSFLGGLGQGGLEGVGHAIILWMWADKSGPPFHAIHMGYPIGSTIAPLIAMPFLGPDDQDDVTTPGYTSTAPSGEWNTTVAMNVTDTAEKVSRIEIPYGIVGGITCFAGVVFIILYFVGQPRGFVYHGTEKNSLLEVFSPASCRAMGSTRHTCVLLGLICAFYVFVNAKDGTISTYIFSYAVESEMDFTKKEAAILDTVIRSMEIVGRVIGVIASHWFRIQPMLFFEVILNTVFTALLAFLGTKTKTNLWIFGCLFRLTAAPVWPSGMTWTSVYVKFSSMVVALTQVVLGTTGYFFSWLSGYLYDTFHPSSFIYYGMVCGYLVLILLIIMQIVASCCAHSEEDDELNYDVFTDEVIAVNRKSERSKL